MTIGGRLGELAAYRGLVLNLTVRDLRLKYKRSAFGVAWSLLNPLFMMLIYTLVFSLFLRVVKSPPNRPYWALVVGGLLAWTFFANAIATATTAFVHNPSLITKVYFPIESLPISGVLAHFFNFVVSLLVLVVVLLVVRMPLGPSLVLLPVIVVAQLGFCVGLGLLLASVTVYFRDLEHLVVLGMTAWFYVTPVLYPLDPAALPAGAARFIPYLMVNPLTWYLEVYHSVLYYGTWPSPALLGATVVAALTVLAGAYALFARIRDTVPEEV
jgi:homopolymeric O-antigen transport system permease protein